MEILYIMIPMATLIALGIALAFYMAVRSGQFDDLEGPGHSIIMDDDKAHSAKPEDKAADAESTAKPQQNRKL